MTAFINTIFMFFDTKYFITMMSVMSVFAVFKLSYTLFFRR